MPALPNRSTPLDALYARLADWMTITEFERLTQDYFLGPRLPREIADYRAKRGALKKLRDEVAPVLHHLQFVKATGHIRFELNNNVPDCWLRASSGTSTQGLEVTVAQSREQHHLDDELNTKGVGRGFLGLPDDAPAEAFSNKLAKRRIMYTSGSVLSVTCNGILQCLKKKNDPKYAGFDLLIEAPLQLIPTQRWTQIYDTLRLAASEMPFREIHVVGNKDSELFGFRIK